MYHGIINVYKEAGFTSHDVVAKLRGICKQKKIGHTGTLDPEAVGVLPVCLGSGTKVCDLLTGKDKEYVAVLRLGVVTDTQDMTGKVLEERAVTVTEEEVRKVIFSFLGEYRQVPPMYSAIKVNGKKLYELARAGKEIEREARVVRIGPLEILSVVLPEVKIRVGCSKGTYIRTLCYDIGQKLGCGGTMESLQRTRSGDYTLETAYTLRELQRLADEGRLQEAVRKVEDIFRHLPAVKVQEKYHKLLENGNRIFTEHLEQLELSAQKAESIEDVKIDQRAVPAQNEDLEWEAEPVQNEDLKQQAEPMQDEDLKQQAEPMQNEDLELKAESVWKDIVVQKTGLMRDEKLIQGNDEVRVYGYTGHFHGIYRYVEAEDCFYPVKMFFAQEEKETGNENHN